MAAGKFQPDYFGTNLRFVPNPTPRTPDGFERGRGTLFSLADGGVLRSHDSRRKTIGVAGS
jgi:hypothetical protein